MLFVIPALVILSWRHRPGHPLDDPPSNPAVATWGAIGRPVDPDATMTDGDEGYDDEDDDGTEYDDADDHLDADVNDEDEDADEDADPHGNETADVGVEGTDDDIEDDRDDEPDGNPTGPVRPGPDVSGPDVRRRRNGAGPRRAASPRRRSPPSGAARSKGSPGSVGRPRRRRRSLIGPSGLFGRFVIFGALPVPDPDLRAGSTCRRAATSWSPRRIAAGWTRSWSSTRSRRSRGRGSSAARPSTFTSRWRERLIHRVGGLLPVWRGGIGIDQHVASARAVIANGAVFAQMPEGTVSGPPGRIGPFRTGWAVIALRTDAPIVPLAMAGTEELYLGRRMASRILPATTARALAGLRRRCRAPGAGHRARSSTWPAG